ncbi:nucleotidyltransferase domain-containing protein [Vibrio parahaemolyticus]|uniref:nucleotidyltransferase family protein n=1 Tax=Vibrio parahaemolyticus TaxID=670 RepID=UPI001A24500D|nr:nucleotidyltransferase domain-containing protein [Vibrio parahaemolyticus]HAS8111342.1 nucleotidyltransferase domain-containing protein [Vibrio vulnificus]
MFIPEFVQSEVEMLSEQECVNSIWLFGSRANGTANEESDWDLLVFQDKDVEYITRDSHLIDVVRVSASGMVQTDGFKHSYPFSSWEWEFDNNESARYIGKHFIEYKDGVRDSSSPVYKKKPCKAYCLWSKRT